MDVTRNWKGNSHLSRQSVRVLTATLLASVLTIPGAGTALADEGRARSGPTATTSNLEATVTDVVSRLASAATAHAESVGGYRSPELMSDPLA